MTTTTYLTVSQLSPAWFVFRVTLDTALVAREPEKLGVRASRRAAHMAAKAIAKWTGETIK